MWAVHTGRRLGPTQERGTATRCGPGGLGTGSEDGAHTRRTIPSTRNLQTGKATATGGRVRATWLVRGRGFGLVDPNVLELHRGGDCKALQTQ